MLTNFLINVSFVQHDFALTWLLFRWKKLFFNEIILPSYIQQCKIPENYVYDVFMSCLSIEKKTPEEK